jgi:hypothetical protein
MREGHLAAEHRVTSVALRERTHPEFAALRQTLLAELGVADPTRLRDTAARSQP